MPSHFFDRFKKSFLINTFIFLFSSFLYVGNKAKPVLGGQGYLDLTEDAEIDELITLLEMLMSNEITISAFREGATYLGIDQKDIFYYTYVIAPPGTLLRKEERKEYLTLALRLHFHGPLIFVEETGEPEASATNHFVSSNQGVCADEIIDAGSIMNLEHIVSAIHSIASIENETEVVRIVEDFYSALFNEQRMVQGHKESFVECVLYCVTEYKKNPFDTGLLEVLINQRISPLFT